MIFWWLQGGSPSFYLRECVFGGTINVKFQSLFCQYVYMIFGVAKKILYLVGYIICIILGLF